MKSSPSIWNYVVSVNLTVKISSIFVAFLENTDFNSPAVQFNTQDVKKSKGYSSQYKKSLWLFLAQQ